MFQNVAVLNNHSFESKKEQFIKLMASTDDTTVDSRYLDLAYLE